MTRLGLIGCGVQGGKQLRAALAQDDARVVGVCDLIQARANQAAADAEAEVFPSPSALGEACDAVIVATPASEHREVCEALLDQGCDLLCEKPLSTSAQEAEAVASFARARGRQLMVAYPERFNPALPALEGVDGPLFVEAERLGPFSDRGTDVDVLRDLLVHDLDLCLAVMDRPDVPAEIEAVMAAGLPVMTGGTDMADVRLHFTDGAVASLAASRSSLKRSRRFRVFHRRGYVSLDLEAGSAQIVRRSGPADAPQLEGDFLERPEGADALRAQLRHFLAVRRGEASIPVDGFRAARLLALAERIARAVAERQERVGL